MHEMGLTYTYIDEFLIPDVFLHTQHPKVLGAKHIPKQYDLAPF